MYWSTKPFLQETALCPSFLASGDDV